MTTAAAAILLREKLGFEVELRDDVSGKAMYAALAAGSPVHLAFEAWPASNIKSFKQYADGDQVSSFPYDDLYGRSGLFEVSLSASRSRFRSLQTADCVVLPTHANECVGQRVTVGVHATS